MLFTIKISENTRPVTPKVPQLAPIKSLTLAFCACALAAPLNAQAESAFTYDGDINAIAQTSDDANLDASTEISADLFLHYKKSSWQVNLHIEGNITPASQSVTANLPESNADAFSVTDQYDNGRIQFSEMYVDYYSKQGTMQQLSFGLMDATAYFDTNAVMNDENTQFIAAPLGNNPTIEFPDYTLGATAILNFGLKPNTQTLIGLFSGEGLADDAQHNYSETFKVDPNKKGLFVITETQLVETTSHHVSGGVWLHSGDHTDINHPNKTDLNNYGAYLTGDHTMGENTLALRLGYSRPEVNDLNKFVGLGIEHQYNAKWTTAAAASFQFASSEAKQTDDTQAYEVYARYQPGQPEFYITPSIQYLTKTALNKDVLVGNLRLSYIF